MGFCLVLNINGGVLCWKRKRPERIGDKGGPAPVARGQRNRLYTGPPSPPDRVDRRSDRVTIQPGEPWGNAGQADEKTTLSSQLGGRSEDSGGRGRVGGEAAAGPGGAQYLSLFLFGSKTHEISKSRGQKTAVDSGGQWCIRTWRLSSVVEHMGVDRGRGPRDARDKSVPRQRERDRAGGGDLRDPKGQTRDPPRMLCRQGTTRVILGLGDLGGLTRPMETWRAGTMTRRRGLSEASQEGARKGPGVGERPGCQQRGGG